MDTDCREDWQMPEQLDTVAAGAFLGLSPRTLERLRVEGGGPAYSKKGPGIRARVYYTAKDLKEWVQKFKYQSTAEYSKRGSDEQ